MTHKFLTSNGLGFFNGSKYVSFLILLLKVYNEQLFIERETYYTQSPYIPVCVPVCMCLGLCASCYILNVAFADLVTGEKTV